jgi:hypothetical protein
MTWRWRPRCGTSPKAGSHEQPAEDHPGPEMVTSLDISAKCGEPY